MRKIGWSVLALTLWTSSAQAQTPAPAAAPSLEVGGLVDVYYDWYSTKPTGDAQYRNFDTKHNQFALSMAQAWLAKAPTESSRVGFKFKLNFGHASSNYIHAFEPGGSTYDNIQEAYVSYLAPTGKGLQIDAGVFATAAGAEVIEAKDNFNYSRGLLFALAIPYYHSGVRLSYAATDKVTLMGGVLNGWNNIEENNTGKTLLGAVTFKPTSKVSVIANYLTGPEKAGTNDGWRNLLDAIVSASVTDKFTLLANYDYGTEKMDSESVSWQGIAGYAKYQATPSVAFSPRFEFFNDADGFATGQVQKLKELTATLELKAADNLQWKLEFRHDMSNEDVFADDKGAMKSSQTSIGFGLTYSFAGKIQ
jgi:hypothetical protein